MGDGSLSQEEIDALLMGTEDTPPSVLDILPENKPPVEQKENYMPSKDIFNKIPITITVVLGETTLTLDQLRSIGEGSIVTLEELAGQDVQIRANNIPIALGEVIVVDENFGVRVTESLSIEKQKEILATKSKSIKLNINQ